MKRVLVGVDGSAESLRAVTWTAALAAGFPDLEVIAVAVYGLEPVATMYGAAVISDDFWESWRRDLQRDLDGEWTQPLRDAGVKVTTHVEEGRAEEVLLRLAGRHEADLVVVGSRGRGHLRGMFLGSVSHALALHAACPVVIVPHHHGHDAPGA